MKFKRYQHVVKLGTPETEGLLNGTVYVFPKVDGANASVWFEEGSVRAGSRNRDLTTGSDNAGFREAVRTTEGIQGFFGNYPSHRLFGEWLVPHTIKNYRDDAWRKFYVFDVINEEGKQLEYNSYKPILDYFEIEYIPPLAIIKNPTQDNLYRILQNNTYLMKDGSGIGEGVVCKNYDWTNKYGRQTWGKIVTSEFKANNHKEFGPPIINGSILIEERIIEEFLKDEMIDKEKWKILYSHGTVRSINSDTGNTDGYHPIEWENKYIPELMGRVFYEFLKDELWSALKKHNNPTINFRLLDNLVKKRIKNFLGV